MYTPGVRKWISLRTLMAVGKLLLGDEPSHLSQYAWSYIDSKVGSIFSTSISRLAPKWWINFAPSFHHVRFHSKNAMYPPERAKLPCLRRLMLSKDGLTLSLPMRLSLRKEVCCPRTMGTAARNQASQTFHNGMWICIIWSASYTVSYTTSKDANWQKRYWHVYLTA